jgi:NAD(P)-dependent dehydrogenase (short-subunit alcohol dehydrogenase family)
MMDAARKVAVVTGAGSGIGRSVALALLREGYSVALTGRRPGALEETSAAAKDAAARVLIAPADVTDERSIEALFTKVKEGLRKAGFVV